MIDPFMAMWADPRPSNPPVLGTRDRLFAIAVATIMVADTLLSPEQVWRPFAMALGLLIAVLLYFRNRSPLGCFLLAFGIAFAVEILSAVTESGWEAPSSYVFALLLPYALCRWGAGWEIGLGVGVLLASYSLAALLGNLSTPTDAIGGAFMLLSPAAFGSTIRFREQSQAQAIERVKLKERENLARELHDTVAHHVSAIAVQAQAGQAVSSQEPELALAVLETIEGAAKRTLGEMRDIVGALRDDDGDLYDFSPNKGLVDVPDLAAQANARLVMHGDFEGLRPAAGAAIYRMIQEAITNAERHATNKTEVWIELRAESETVTLRVKDDGDGALLMPSAGTQGFGLLGLAERATLLGGQLEAGPDPAGGWRVEAVLPRKGEGKRTDKEGAA